MFGKILSAAIGALVLWGVAAHASTGSSGERVYVVQPGDTLWAIASARYAGDVREAEWRIRRRNGLDGALIRPGERLVLP
jgi:membrane-bound lytic murein transglycosylase D